MEKERFYLPITGTVFESSYEKVLKAAKDLNVEVFPNFFIIYWKRLGSENVHAMVTREDFERQLKRFDFEKQANKVCNSEIEKLSNSELKKIFDQSYRESSSRVIREELSKYFESGISKYLKDYLDSDYILRYSNKYIKTVASDAAEKAVEDEVEDIDFEKIARREISEFIDDHEDDISRMIKKIVREEMAKKEEDKKK